MALFNKKAAAVSPEELTGDALLVDRARKGDKDAFGSLVETYQTFVYRTVYYDVRDPDDAADIAQEVFIKAYKGLGSFRCDSEFSTWLYRICKNAVCDHIRKNGREKTQPISSLSSDEDGTPPDFPDTDGKYDPEKQLLKKEKGQLVRECLNELSEEHREIIVLRDIHGYSYEEIGEFLSLEDGTVKSRLSRARNALRKLLEAKNLYE